MALMRAVREQQEDPLVEELELLTPAQQARLKGGAAFRVLLRISLWSALVFLLPPLGSLLAIFVAVLLGFSETLAVVVGIASLSAFAFCGFIGGQRYERASAAAELERRRRLVAHLRQLDVSSVSSTSSVAVPAMSSTTNRPR
jgi:hypothetical protein